MTIGVPLSVRTFVETFFSVVPGGFVVSVVEPFTVP